MYLKHVDLHSAGIYRCEVSGFPQNLASRPSRAQTRQVNVETESDPHKPLTRAPFHSSLRSATDARRVSHARDPLSSFPIASLAHCVSILFSIRYVPVSPQTSAEAPSFNTAEMEKDMKVFGMSSSVQFLILARRVPSRSRAAFASRSINICIHQRQRLIVSSE